MFIVQNNFLKSVIIIPKTEEVSKNNTSASIMSMFGGNSGGSGFTFGSQTPLTQGGWFIFNLARNFLIAICLLLLSFSENPLSCYGNVPLQDSNETSFTWLFRNALGYIYIGCIWCSHMTISKT